MEFGVEMVSGLLKFDLNLKHFAILVFQIGYLEKKILNKEWGNGILLPKLFGPTVRKIVLVIEKNFLRSLEQYLIGGNVLIYQI